MKTIKFNTRREARIFAKENGTKIIDLGRDKEIGQRWAVMVNVVASPIRTTLRCPRNIEHAKNVTYCNKADSHRNWYKNRKSGLIEVRTVKHRSVQAA